MQNRSVIVQTLVRSIVALGLSMAEPFDVASGGTISPIVAVRGKTARNSWSLKNLSCGASPGGAIDPSRPTFVITHGWNPAPNFVYLSTPEAYAQKIRSRYGADVNVLAFHWDSRYQGLPRQNNANAMRAGRILGEALIARGVVPETTHMIGHSMGSIVVSAAARQIHGETSRCTDQLTMIDGPSSKVRLFIDQLGATQHANRVVNVWASGITGAGRRIDHPGVENVRVPNRRARPRFGRRRFQNGHDLRPAVINHMDILIWYYQHQL